MSPPDRASRAPDWLAVAIGNTRQHWGCFCGDLLLATWDSRHLQARDLGALVATAPAAFQTAIAAEVPLYLASVVAAQTRLWRQQYPPLREVPLAAVPLGGLYPTLGIDRALVLLGAGERYGFPVLAIDGGTALTLTGADGERRLVGGAILPGLRLQQQVLAEGTSALPALARLPQTLPPRWGRGTPEAITSGILYGAIAAIADFGRAWQQAYPDSTLVLTGGDGPLLQAGLQQQVPELGAVCQLDARIDLVGLQASLRSGY